MMPFRGANVGLVAIEVKLPNAKSSQLLSDRAKLALECKRMVDEQVLQGSQNPRSFGILVEGKILSLFYKHLSIQFMYPFLIFYQKGYECRIFSCTLMKTGFYAFVEEESFLLMKTMNDLALLPDIVRVFCRVKVDML